MGTLKEIYDVIASKGGATSEEIGERFGLPAEKLENGFAIHWHCKLVKGQRRKNGVYIVPFEDSGRGRSSFS